MKRLLSALLTVAFLAAPAMAFAAPGHGPDHDRWDQHRRYDEHHKWRKGDHFDREDYGRASVVDWKTHHLKRPKAGYEWRQVDNRYVEIALATGIIAAIVNAH